MFLGFWGIGLSLLLYTSTHFPKWFIYIGIASSLGTFMGVLEGAGWKFASQVVSISSSILILWIVVFGFFLCRVPAAKLVYRGFYRKVGENSFERVG
jgi:phosphate starvation-inducible membrane PsiE